MNKITSFSIVRPVRKWMAVVAAVAAIGAALMTPQAASAAIIIQPASCVQYLNNNCTYYQSCAIDTDNRTWRCDKWSNPNGNRAGIFETTTGSY